MWEEEDEDEEDYFIEPDSKQSEELLSRFSEWESGATGYFSEIELEFLYEHFWHASRKNNAQVKKVLELGIDTFPNSAVFYLYLAMYYLENDLPKTAIPILFNAKLLDPMNPNVTMRLSECYEALGEYNKSYEILKETESSIPEFNLELQIKLTTLLFRFERKDEAMHKLVQLVKFDCSNDIECALSPMIFDHETVLEATETLINEDPFNCNYWLFKGQLALMYIEDVELAIESYEYAHYLNEKDSQAIFSLGLCHQESKHYNLAKKYFTEASEAGYPKEDCIIHTAICMNRLEDYAQARFILLNLLSNEEANRDVVYAEIGYSYLYQGDAAKAMPYIKKSLGHFTNIENYLLLGEAALMLNDTDELINSFNLAKLFYNAELDYLTSRFFGLFLRAEELTYMYEVYVFHKTEDSESEFSLLTMLLAALIARTEGKNLHFMQEMMNCFTLNAADTIEYLEMIDKDLVQDPEIMNLKELF
ncbi:MAG: hypothetical protein LC109_00485 [Bacteroidia bacterium]|nr:hypothetical protein [Bacteroidia bacterium]MCO5254918.1 hypothetical protein [Bacteroidota bacterium]MCZ2128727.1 hypothetical protein [Bacteroidia bacterium]